ncbi:bifunctional tRNA (5-methylaminomethyl-2-thiouridine)(34)-methyltransferase MnmD/FAD-dependent 5-carboxymethylaminomethyl-2-thiouridine(34) oxidoreductase MnmC [Gulbenkiania mobilis]|uniref:bifunctional tRNA (5-methylaminomethyl-2-thiouridine)(34)-methyltransferase MnmD/FAD-dependent 5-carboxymethylaminomethyl-2-thiouridine(34) oxidoreductase MnmC n=1 Tax=Gulbenkiania mobilis TaxID=397457 RepID=UPI0006BBA849|nr:bifunctional tRNA (5-methylaminomethyl-2-thiouridine)(34)-methyltransferase MnmD/FAD-dependent 5-carboxymethylaminomethyl-2-thiouridine(34) oxidoreductase MnmC [Gulbenkiania mobilis]
MTSHASLDWQDGQPVSPAFGDVYFSRESGLEETRHVFLAGNRLPERFAALPAGARFTIAETGFGTGLNFLAAWACFLAHAPADSRLSFVSTEKFPLRREDMARALALWPELERERDALLTQYGSLPSGWHRFLFEEGRVTLTLLVGDVLETLPELDAQVDAWFLDGFAPARNPDMWQPALFAQVARLCAPHGTFATFTSAGAVRRGLAEAGFAVRKVPGHGLKREMSIGELERPPQQGWQAPWYACPTPPVERSAIVIGGGIAGASTAFSLAERGWRVTLVERHPQLAQEASGNPQGVLYAKLSAHFPPLTRLILAGYGYTLRTLQARHPASEATWAPCGVLQLAYDEEEAARQQKLASAGLPDTLLRTVDQITASALAGLPMPSGGLFFPEGGWVNPPSLVERLATHPRITRRCGEAVLELDWNPEERLWVAQGERAALAMGAVVVLASAAEAAAFDSTRHLPLKRIRGQVTVTPATEASRALKTVLCGHSYISPVRYNTHCMGATFKFNTEDASVNLFEHQENLDMLSTLAPSVFHALGGPRQAMQALGGRAAFRCTTPDYLPLVGPVADAAAFNRVYAPLARDATEHLTTPAPWVPGLYVNTGHGSRGLITAPLSGEVIAACVEGEPAPLPRSLLNGLHPSRFLLRNLVRRKTPRPAGATEA